MHELAVTQSVLRIAVQHAEQAGAIRVKEINLVIGELSSIVDDSVQFFWDMVSEGTIAHGSILNFRRIPAALRCDDCQHQFPLDRERFICPNCGGRKVNVSSGDEFFLESIDVDFPPG